MAKRPARPDTTATRNATLAYASVGALVAAVGAGVAGYWLRRRAAARPSGGEHAAPDLALNTPRNDGSKRAPVDFRPDPTAPVSAAEREALRPATGPSPTLVADRGGVRSQR